MGEEVSPFMEGHTAGSQSVSALLEQCHRMEG